MTNDLWRGRSTALVGWARTGRLCEGEDEAGDGVGHCDGGFKKWVE